MPITPIIDTTKIKENIAAFIQAVTGQSTQGSPVTWAFEWQPAAKPLKPYAVYKITGPRKIGGLDEIRALQLEDSEGNPIFDDFGNPVFNEYDKMGEREFTVSIECGSNDELATILVTNLMAALEQPQFVSILEDGGYSVRGIMGVQDVTSLLVDSTKFERRAVLEFYLVAASIALYDAGQITGITAEINGQAPNLQTIQIPLDASPE